MYLDIVEIIFIGSNSIGHRILKFYIICFKYSKTIFSFLFYKLLYLVLYILMELCQITNIVTINQTTILTKIVKNVCIKSQIY